MTPHKVVGLGYVEIEALDLDAWVEFGSGLLGFEVAELTVDRLLLRIDAKAYRFDVRRSERDRVSALGWEVQSPAALEELGKALANAGYDVQPATPALLAERRVSDLIRFQAGGLTLELFYGLLRDQSQFASPTGARFVTGVAGVGHALQLVDDVEATWNLYVDILGFELSDKVLAPDGDVASFLHCNPRHHSFAFGAANRFAAGVGHLMVEVDDLDIVGRAYDRVLAGAAPLTLTFGRHTNDEMLSFYARTPSGFEIEYGFGGKVLGPDHCPDSFEVASYWGHQWVGGPGPDA